MVRSQKLGQKYPAHFADFFGSSKWHCYMDLSVQFNRIRDQGACSVQSFTDGNGQPLDQERFEPLFEVGHVRI